MDRAGRGDLVTGDAWGRYGWQRDELPKEPLSDNQRARLELPRALRPIPGGGIVQRPVFEPALKQFPNAYRAADPQFADEQDGRRWYAARRVAVDLVLAAIAASAYSDSLVLRGSVLLRAWYGDAAREPGDLDFVVQPVDWQIDEPRTGAMLEAIAQASEQASGGDGVGVRIVAAGAVSDEIWTYDRVPGRRLMLPWEADGLPGGWIQLDFVFNEHLPLAPEPTLLPAASGGPGALLLGATPELSLAWKIMWLVTDMHPQGKDLYDAVLLAEHTALRYEVLHDVFNHAEQYYVARPLRSRHIAELSTEWDHFRAEYPQQPASDEEHVRRLVAALAPTFTTLGGQAVTEYEFYVAWLASWIERCTPLLARTDLHTVQTTMAEAHIPVLSAIVITRELLGRENNSVDHARRLVVENPAWGKQITSYWYESGEFAAALASFGLDLSTGGRAASPESRLARRIRKDFPQPGSAPEVLRLLAGLAADTSDPMLGTERVLAAVALLAAGSIKELRSVLALARTDWRELLVAAQLAEADWPARLDAELGR